MLTRHDDLTLRYVLNVPSGKPPDAELPLVLVMHGRGADSNDLADIAPSLDGGYRFVFPNAPRPFEIQPGMTYGFSWFDGWPPVGNSFAESREHMLTFLDEVLKRYPTPAGKVIVSGFSQGGLMAFDVGYRTRQPIAGIVCMSGALNENDLPDLDAHRDIPVLIVHGTADDMIPLRAARRSRAVLEEHGIEPEYHEYAMGHHVTDESLAEIRRFMAARLL